jgi:aspartate/methionine/tyrosine aminotransferase
VVSVFSFSKTYAMTGWRVGYLVAPRPVVDTVTKLVLATLSCVATPSQRAALAALRGPQAVTTEMVAAYRRRRDRALSILDGGPVCGVRPAGAFYLWLDHRRSGLSSAEFAGALLDRERVAVVPGPAFGPGGEGYLRLSLAVADDVLTEGVGRLVRFASERETSYGA